MATALATPFYLDMGFSKTEIGVVAKQAALWPMIIGGIAGRNFDAQNWDQPSSMVVWLCADYFYLRFCCAGPCWWRIVASRAGYRL